MMSPTARRVIVFAALLVSAALATGFAILVWPTRYHYDRIQMPGETAPGAVFPIRIDRFAGTAEILLPEMLNDSRHNMGLAWVGLTGVPLPADVLAELGRRILVDVEPLPYAQIFNTTNWRITRLRWRIVRSGGDSANPSQPGHFDQSVFIQPHTVARLYLELGRFGHGVSIAFDTAWGERVP